MYPGLALRDGQHNHGGQEKDEPRRNAGHYEGKSSGISIPVASIGGRSVRYRVGASRGHYVQGAPVPTPVDTGTVYITNKRVISQCPWFSPRSGTRLALGRAFRCELAAGRSSR